MIDNVATPLLTHTLRYSLLPPPPPPPSTMSDGHSLGGMQSQRAADLYAYAKSTLDPIIQPMIAKLMLDQPANPVDAMITYLQNLSPSTTQSHAASADMKSYDETMDEKQNDQPNELPTLSINDDTQSAPRQRGRRAGVSAEPVSADALSNTVLRVIQKSDEDIASIKTAIKHNILFNHIDSDSMTIVINAMEKKVYTTGDTIIKQGETGNEFFVLAHGLADCFVNNNKVKQYIVGESFGELALMYNCVRQASIVAATDVNVWAMDRQTFHTVLMKTTSTKRTQYETFLTNVPILQTLDKYERSKIADALVSTTYEKNDVIIKQGDTADRRFFILEHGACKASKVLAGGDGTPVDVFTYSKQGDYFGELALINDQPRQASVICTADNTVVVSLDRDSFDRLLGPAEQLLKRNTEVYETIEKQITASRRGTGTGLSDISAQLSSQAVAAQ